MPAPCRSDRGELVLEREIAGVVAGLVGGELASSRGRRPVRLRRVTMTPWPQTSQSGSAAPQEAFVQRDASPAHHRKALPAVAAARRARGVTPHVARNERGRRSG